MRRQSLSFFFCVRDRLICMWSCKGTTRLIAIPCIAPSIALSHLPHLTAIGPALICSLGRHWGGRNSLKHRVPCTRYVVSCTLFATAGFDPSAVPPRFVPEASVTSARRRGLPSAARSRISPASIEARARLHSPIGTYVCSIRFPVTSPQRLI